MKTKFTKGKWVNGWGNGLTGPTTASRQPFCSEDRNYIPISIDKETIALIPLPKNNSKKQMKANALLISKAPEMFDCLLEMICAFENNSLTNVDYAKKILKEATEL